MEFLSVLWVSQYVIVVDALQPVRFLVPLLLYSLLLQLVSHLGYVEILEGLLGQTGHVQTSRADSLLLQPDVLDFGLQYVPKNAEILIKYHLVWVQHRVVKDFLSVEIYWLSEDDEDT